MRHALKLPGLTQKIIREHYNPDTAHLPAEAVVRKIARDVVDTYAKRAKRRMLTGE